MQIYLGGAIQGSNKDISIVDQDYRAIIKEFFINLEPNLKVYCPFDDGGKISDTDSDEYVKELMLRFLENVKKSDIFIGIFPTASNGTAIELYEAWNSNIPAFVISPLAKNIALRSFATKIFPDINDFKLFFKTYYYESRDPMLHSKGK